MIGLAAEAGPVALKKINLPGPCPFDVPVLMMLNHLPPVPPAVSVLPMDSHVPTVELDCMVAAGFELVNTCNFPNGLAVPIPTSPLAALTVTRSVLFVKLENHDSSMFQHLLY
ncbi:MAG: hypothetical protein IPK03_04480 [Bacteroidetes bacterium]|nr:hypothetical protein [Bacteroidota bacterium]